MCWYKSQVLNSRWCASDVLCCPVPSRVSVSQKHLVDDDDDDDDDDVELLSLHTLGCRLTL